MLIFHISLALISLIWVAVTWFAPSNSKLVAVYSLTASTLATGTYLVIAHNRPVLHACVSGLLFLSVSMIGIVASQRKLAHQSS